MNETYNIAFQLPSKFLAIVAIKSLRHLFIFTKPIASDKVISDHVNSKNFIPNKSHLVLTIHDGQIFEVALKRTDNKPVEFNIFIKFLSTNKITTTNLLAFFMNNIYL